MAKQSSSSTTITVDTNQVRNAADTLKGINNRMDSDFSSVVNAINKVNGSWDGTASNKAISKFNKIKREFMGSSGRKAVMNNFIKFLCSAVAIDYDATETANTELSSMFR